MKSLFWGIFLIGSGGFFLLRHYFNLNISTTRFLIGFFIICLGFSILIGDNVWRKDEKSFIFGEGNAIITEYTEEEHNIIFGSGTIDFSSLEGNSNGTIEVNVVFGSGKIILPSDRKVIIKANSVFASTIFPDSSELAFGEKKYEQGTEDSGKGTLNIELNTVFGRTEIK